MLSILPVGLSRQSASFLGNQISVEVVQDLFEVRFQRDEAT